MKNVWKKFQNGTFFSSEMRMKEERIRKRDEEMEKRSKGFESICFEYILYYANPGRNCF